MNETKTDFVTQVKEEHLDLIDPKLLKNLEEDLKKRKQKRKMEKQTKENHIKKLATYHLQELETFEPDYEAEPSKAVDPGKEGLKKNSRGTPNTENQIRERLPEEKKRKITRR